MLGGHGLADLYTGMPSEVEAILPGNSHTSYNSTQLNSKYVLACRQS